MAISSTIVQAVRRYIELAPYLLVAALLTLASTEFHADGPVYLFTAWIVLEFAYGVAGLTHAHWTEADRHPDIRTETDRYETGVIIGTLVAIGILQYEFVHPWLESFAGTDATPVIAAGWVGAFLLGQAIARVLTLGLGDAAALLAEEVASDEDSA